MRQISTYLFLSVGLAACAGGPPPATATHPTTVASVPPAAAPAPAGADGQASSDIRDKALKAGYRQQLVGGKVVYCREETPLGTRFPETACLNATQLSARFSNADQTRDDLRRTPGMAEGIPK